MTVTVKLNTQAIASAMEEAMLATAQHLHNYIVEITPRDIERLPQNINRKDGKVPKRKGRVVIISSNYYNQITGNLKRAIYLKQKGKYEYVIGTNVEYAIHLEFGTATMKERSFLRRGLEENRENMIKILRKNLYRALKSR